LRPSTAPGTRSALITGGSGDIGRTIAYCLAQLGFAVGIGCTVKNPRAEYVADKCRAYGVAAVTLPADLSRPGGFGRVAERFAEHFDGVDVLITCAADYKKSLIESISDETYDAMFTLNARSVFEALRWAAGAMRDGGRIITVSSLNSVLCAPGSAVYAGSKAAIEAFTKVAAKELGVRGITVNSLLPGAVDTVRLRDEFSASTCATLARRSSMGRLGTPADIAGAVRWLTGADAGWVTGQMIRVDGGLGP
jgi:3-oxoacyl-[acyl-carrier protein] reductase